MGTNFGAHLGVAGGGKARVERGRRAECGVEGLAADAECGGVGPAQQASAYALFVAGRAS